MTADLTDRLRDRREEQIPRLDAYLQHSHDGNDNWRAWCVYCTRWHSHGAAGGAGHREAHCWTPAGLARYRRGYLLEPAGEWGDLTPSQQHYGPAGTPTRKRGQS